MLNVTIRSARRLLLDGWVNSVRLPGFSGEFEVLGFHVPFVAALAPGRIWIEGTVPKRKVLPVRGGLAWLAAERLLVIADEAPIRGSTSSPRTERLNRSS